MISCWDCQRNYCYVRGWRRVAVGHFINTTVIWTSTAKYRCQTARETLKRVELRYIAQGVDVSKESDMRPFVSVLYEYNTAISIHVLIIFAVLQCESGSFMIFCLCIPGKKPLAKTGKLQLVSISLLFERCKTCLCAWRHKSQPRPLFLGNDSHHYFIENNLKHRSGQNNHPINQLLYYLSAYTSLIVNLRIWR